ncbi:MAG: hypothetical protein DWG76_07625 [Chloroflexi bacterium]|nr:hypothetical protein [Chloroflexota bacterium]MQC27295.1 hypothetical protein [Chloroflexota bacterium]
MFAYAIFQALPAQREDERLARIAPYYWLASIANSTWIFLWHYQVFTLTIVAMGTLLLSLIAIYQVAKRSTGIESRGFRWAVLVPFSIYLGWISVATIANVSQLLFFLEWDMWGLSAELWTGIMLVVATGLGMAMLERERDIAFVLVLIWAFVGIAVAHADVMLVATSAWVVSGVLGLGVLVAAVIRV